MTLEALFDRTEGSRKRISVYTSDHDASVESRLAARNATVEHRNWPVGGEFVVVREGDTFLGAIPRSALRALLEPSIVPPWDLEAADEGLRALFELLDETTFVSLDRRQLLVAAREVEEHAWRVGAGALHAGFQSTEAFSDQRPVYERLARETDLDVHVYATSVPEDTSAGVTFHTEPADCVGRFWFLAFDGSGDDARKCALVARQEAPGEYSGFWTYDPKTVDESLAAVRPDER